MRKSRFTEEQIAYALRQVEAGTSVTQLCRKMGISEQDVLRLEAALRGDGRRRAEEGEAARGRGSAAEGPGGRPDPGQADAPGGPQGKMVKPAGKRRQADHRARALPRGKAQGLQARAAPILDVLLPVAPTGRHSAPGTAPGTCAGAPALGLPAPPHPAAPRGLVGEQEADAPDLPRGRALGAHQGPEEAREPLAGGARGANCGEPAVGDGLRAGPVAQRRTLPGLDRGRHLHSAVPRDRGRTRRSTARRLQQRWTGSPRPGATRRPSPSTTARSSTRERWTPGPIGAASAWTSSGPGKPVENGFIESFQRKAARRAAQC